MDTKYVLVALVAVVVAFGVGYSLNPGASPQPQEPQTPSEPAETSTSTQITVQPQTSPSPSPTPRPSTEAETNATSSPTDTPNQTQSPGDPANLTVDTVSYPVGTSPNGITNVSALFQQHSSRLGDNYTRVLTVIQTENGSTTANFTTTTKVDRTSGHYYEVQESNIEERTVENYITNSTRYEKVSLESRTEYQRYALNFSFNQSESRVSMPAPVRLRLETTNLTAVEVVSIDGEPAIRFESGFDAAGRISLVVTLDGLIHNITVYNLGENITQVSTYEYRRIGNTTVSEPPWIDKANNTALN